jgi:Putative Ig domain
MTRRLAIMMFCCFGSCLLAGQNFQIQTIPGQGAVAGQLYVLPLTVTGGTHPYTWQLAGGTLPPGCRLDIHSGKISGTPSAAGDYHFTVVVSDSSIPQSHAQREFTIHVIEGVTIEWKEPPQVHGNAIRGSAIVSNATAEELSLTVVVVAVNDIGRATALGYQHFKLAANQTSPVIPFGSAPGPGTYYVRADATAHRSSHHHVYRTSKQSEPMKVTQF